MILPIKSRKRDPGVRRPKNNKLKRKHLDKTKKNKKLYLFYLGWKTLIRNNFHLLSQVRFTYAHTISFVQVPELAFALACYRRRQWHPTPELLPGESNGWRSLVGCSPWGRWESDMTEWLHFHFSLLCTGEGNGNSLQCSCLENPRDRGAWWAAFYGVAKSQTRLKQHSSSSSSWHAIMTTKGLGWSTE